MTDKARYFATADIYVSPATGRESFGIVLLEAMAAGTPIVCSDIHGYRSVVRRDEQGLLVPPKDVNALAAALGAVARRPGTARAYGRVGPRTGPAVLVAQHHGQGRGLLQVRHPPRSRRRGRCPSTSIGECWRLRRRYRRPARQSRSRSWRQRSRSPARARSARPGAGTGPRGPAQGRRFSTNSGPLPQANGDSAVSATGAGLKAV